MRDENCTCHTAAHEDPRCPVHYADNLRAQRRMILAYALLLAALSAYAWWAL